MKMYVLFADGLLLGVYSCEARCHEAKRRFHEINREFQLWQIKIVELDSPAEAIPLV